MKPLVTVRRYPKGTRIRSVIVVVGKRVASLATERNLIKRRLRAIARELPVGRDYTLVAHPGAGDVGYEELKRHVHG